MEFHGLDGIIETLLVGAIVSVSLMSLVFFFFGHVLQVKVIRKLLEFLVYEKSEAINLEESPHLRSEPPAYESSETIELERLPHLQREPRVGEPLQIKEAASKAQEIFLVVLVVSSL